MKTCSSTGSHQAPVRFLVLAARVAAADREAADRLAEARLPWRDSAAREAVDFGSRFIAIFLLCERFAAGFLPG